MILPGRRVPPYLLSQVPVEVANEERSFGDHVHYDVIDEYDNLKLKMLKFFRDTVSLYRAHYYIKVVWRNLACPVHGPHLLRKLSSPPLLLMLPSPPLLLTFT
jgi:hypothetical protein